RPAARQASVPVWASLAAAAAALIAVGLGSYFYFVQPSPDIPPGGQFAGTGQPPAAPTPDPAKAPQGDHSAAVADVRPPVSPDRPRDPQAPEPLPPPVAVNDKPKDPVNPTE